MSWFGFGGSKKPEDDHTEKSMKIDDFDHHNDFSASSTNFAAPSMPVGGGASLGQFEQEVMLEQQKAMIMTLALRVTELAFDNCVTKPSSSLSSSEQSCIASITGKYFDSSRIIASRFSGGH